jgi:hypothetical protein
MNTPHKTTSKTSTRQGSKSLLTGSLIALLIALTPYIFYSYESFPDVKSWETFLFTYNSNFYESVKISVWTFMGKFIPLLLLGVWFLTCKHWWYHVILIPIAMFLFQIISALNDDIRFSDVVEIWFLIPIMCVIVPLVYLIRAKIFYSMHNPTLEEIELELQQKKSIFSHFKDIFRN